jgi:hypothetical protein
MILALFLPSASTKTLPIYDERSLLLAKEASVKASRRKDSFLKSTKRKPLAGFSIYH